jgi:SpoIIAA-like
MLRIVEGFPEGVVAVAAEGRVTAKDYDEVLIPRVKEAFRRHGKVRCYYELGREFSGIDPEAAWKDFRIGVEHFSNWERLAVVTDVEWIRLAMKAFGFLMPGELRVFGTGQVSEAREWVGGTGAADA